MIRIAFYGKGGIGKSTTVSNLTEYWADRGMTVLQIGCDPKADSTMSLRCGHVLPSVMEMVRRREPFELDEVIFVRETAGGGRIICAEAGGPTPGQGCAGRGIITALETLREKGILAKYRPDVILYDVLGDVVCGGFAMPMREGYASKVYILTSGENMAVYAAANIGLAVEGFKERGYAQLGGLILNRRNVKREEEKVLELAQDLHTEVIGRLDRSDTVQEAEELGVRPMAKVVSYASAGVDPAIATCGTAFGGEHAKIVRRLIADDSLGAVQLRGPLNVEGQQLSSRIVFTFDGDAAGQKAALHAFGLDSSFLTQTFVAVAPDNLDPCDLRIERGNDALRQLIANAKPLFDFVIDTAIDRFATAYTTGQMGAVKAVAPLIAQIRDESLWDLYARKVARRIGVELDVLRHEVRAARRQLRVRGDDAYAPKRRYEQSEREQRAPAPEQARRMEAANAQRQSFYRIQDPVFICEQQFMATLIQIPRAINPELFRALTVHCFQTPVFQTLFQAVEVAGGLPVESISQGLWLHNLTKAGGPMLSSAITELAVMPLPLLMPANATHNDEHGAPAAQPLREASAEERQYANQLLAKLLDVGYMRRIDATKHRMARTADTQEQIRLLSVITETEKERKDLQSRIFGGNIG